MGAPPARSIKMDSSDDEDEDDDDLCYMCDLCERRDYAIGFVTLNHQTVSPGRLLKEAHDGDCVTEILQGETAYLAEYNVLYCEIEKLMKLDDKDQFAAFLRKHEEKLLNFGPNDLLNLIIRNSAIGCLTALLESQLPVNVNQEYSACYPLEWVARDLSFGMTNILLQHGAEPDATMLCDTPLAAATRLLSHQKCLNWKPGDPFLNLFKLFCLPVMKEPLATIRVLASHSKEVENLCTRYIEIGENRSLAALLMVAWDKLLVQLGSGGLEKTPVGQYIFGQLKREAENQHLCETTTSDTSSSLEKKKRLVDAFYLVKTFCLFYIFAEQLDPSMFEVQVTTSGKQGVPKCVLPVDIAYELVNEGGVLKDPNIVYDNNIECLLSKFTSEAKVLSKFTSEAKVLSELHFVSIIRAFTEHERTGTSGFSTLPSMSSSPYFAFRAWQGANFNHLKLKPVVTQRSKSTLVKPPSRNVLALARVCAPIMWLAKRTIK